MDKIVLNSSVLIILDKLGLLSILKDLFKEIYIPLGVYEEVSKKHKIPSWIRIIKVKNEKFVKLLREKLGLEESEAIILAIELNTNLIGLDDKQARKIAKKLGLNVIGTIGLLVLAKKKQIINESLENILIKLRKLGFYLSDDLISTFLKLYRNL